MTGAPTLGGAEHILALAVAGHVYVYSGMDRETVRTRAHQAKAAMDAATVNDAATHWIQPEHFGEALRRLQGEFGPARVHVMDPIWTTFTPPSGRAAFRLSSPEGEPLATVYHDSATGQWSAFWSRCGHMAKGGFGRDLHRLFRHVERFLSDADDCAVRCSTFERKEPSAS